MIGYKVKKTKSKNWKACNLIIMACTFTCFSIISIASADTSNVGLKGTLVSRPCQLEMNSQDLEVSFGDVAEKYFYSNQRTAGKDLEIKLVNCDLNSKKIVKIKFIGQESNQLPGLLAISDNSLPVGLAIGLETNDGISIAFNKATPLENITMVEDLIYMKTFLQGEPEAVNERKISIGTFSATSGLEIEYE